MLRAATAGTVLRLVRYTAAGAAGTIAQYVTLVVLVRCCEWDAVLASAAGMVLGALINYHLNYRYTFRSGARHRRAMARFFAVAAAALAINSLVMTILADLVGLHYVASQLCATILVLLFGFAANQACTFRGHTDDARR
jgi:putative flippase GtrA